MIKKHWNCKSKLVSTGQQLLLFFNAACDFRFATVPTIHYRLLSTLYYLLGNLGT